MQYSALPYEIYGDIVSKEHLCKLTLFTWQEDTYTIFIYLSSRTSLLFNYGVLYSIKYCKPPVLLPASQLSNSFRKGTWLFYLFIHHNCNVSLCAGVLRFVRYGVTTKAQVLRPRWLAHLPDVYPFSTVS